IVFLDASIESSLDGIDLFKEIKSNNAQLPVVVMTSKNNSGVISKVLDISAGDYLVQPLSIKKIHHCLFNIKNKPYSLSGESV
ncbi:response regulator, partial [Photobacterium sanctipauli]